MKFTGWFNIPNLLDFISRIHEPTKHTILTHLLLPRSVPRIESLDLTFSVLKYRRYRPQPLNRCLRIAHKRNGHLIRLLCLFPKFGTIVETFLCFPEWTHDRTKETECISSVLSSQAT